MDRIETLKRLREALALFHVANDAEDHWSGAEATEIRQRAVKTIRELLSEAPFLLTLFPTLEHELETVHVRDISWSTWVALESELRAAGVPPRVE